MCGILGISGTIDPGLLQRLTNLLAHRGPDGAGSYSDPLGRMHLGHRRLAILDTEGGAQPLGNETGEIWVSFNGEIYNFLELREALAASGRHRLATRSDTEVLVHLYEDEGPDFLRRLNGMFAFGLWDARRGRLLLARDRLGVKPLYWTMQGGRLMFASEMKALLAFPGFERRLDAGALAGYLALRYIPEPATIWTDIKMLEPGHYLEWEPGGEPRIRRYWALDYSDPLDEPDEVLADRVEDLLLDAVRLRLRSDVPVGALLSGGIDSSLVVAMIRKLHQGPLHTFCLGFADRPADKQDIRYAGQVAEQYGTLHHQHLMAAGELSAALPALAAQFDQPFSGVVSTWFLAAEVRRTVKVVLSGEGADEAFASYGHHRLVWPLESLARATAAGVSDPWAVADLRPLEARRDLLRRFVGMSPWEMRASFGAFDAEGRGRLLDTPAGREVAAFDPARHLRPLFEAATARDPLNRLLEVDMRSSLPGEVLCFGDRLSMAHGVEMRGPFLDYRMAELAARIPGRQKIKGNSLKHVLRLVAARHLPAAIIERPKEGFVQPNHVWLHGPLAAMVDEILTPDALARHGLFHPAEVRRLIDHNRSRNGEDAFRLWTLVMFQAWWDSADPPVLA